MKKNILLKYTIVFSITSVLVYIYKDFVEGYEDGMAMVDIAKRNHVSERTIYRYKAYYDKVKENGSV